MARKNKPKDNGAKPAALQLDSEDYKDVIGAVDFGGKSYDIYAPTVAKLRSIADQEKPAEEAKAIFSDERASEEERERAKAYIRQFEKLLSDVVSNMVPDMIEADVYENLRPKQKRGLTEYCMKLIREYSGQAGQEQGEAQPGRASAVASPGSGD